MSEKNYKGLGDRVANFTKKTGIDKLVHAVVEDCGCEERQKKLNALFPGRNVAMDPADVQGWEELMPAVERGRLNRHQTRAMYDIYNRTFNANAKPCNCTGKNKAIVDKLERAYEYSCKV